MSIRKLLTLAKRSLISYIGAEILTSIEAALLAVVLHMCFQWTLEAAIAFSIAVTFPLVFIQMAIIFYLTTKAKELCPIVLKAKKGNEEKGG